MKRSEATYAKNDIDSAHIQPPSEVALDVRILAYVTAVILNSPNDYCCVSQEVIRTKLEVRKQAVVESLRRLVEQGKLIRSAGENRNRKSPKYYYRLPAEKLSGNSIKSSFLKSIVTKEKKEEVLIEERKDIGLTGVSKWRNLGRLELIEAYIDSGLEITPLIEKDKRPLTGWNKDYRRNQSKDQLLKYFVENPNLNIGCWMPENLVAVDVDDEEAFYKLTNGETWDTLTSSSGRGFHYWFTHCGTIGSGNGIRPHLDYKTRGSLVVLPPSIHWSGRPYEWTVLVEPINAPQVIQEFYDTRENIKSVPTTSENFQTSRKFSPLLTKGVILVEGQRYDQLFRFGRQLRWRMNTEDLAAKLHDYNDACCKPPLNGRRMRELLDDVISGAIEKIFAGHVIPDSGMSLPKSEKAIPDSGMALVKFVFEKLIFVGDSYP